MPKSIESLPVIRHFKNVDDLISNGTDNPLAPNQEALAHEIGNRLVQEAKDKCCRGLVLITSPKKRTQETAQIIQKRILENNLKAPLVINHNLRELDQGKFVLPPEYKAGDFFEPLSEAWKAFWSETFIDHNNLLYRFGDPYSQGELRYPELQGHFLSFGESYRDYSVRLYSAVYDFGKRLNNFKQLKPVIVTHDSFRVNFLELENIGKEIHNGNLSVTPGSLPRLTWDNYCAHKPSQLLDYGKVSVVSTSSLLDPEVLNILQQEINILNQLS